MLAGLDGGRRSPAGAWSRARCRVADVGRRREERRALPALVIETLRHRSRLDHLLSRPARSRPLADLPPPIRAALRLGAVQLVVLDGIPPHAAVHTRSIWRAAPRAPRHRRARQRRAAARRARGDGRAGQQWRRLRRPPIRWRPSPCATRIPLAGAPLDRPAGGRTEPSGPAPGTTRIPDYWLRLRPGAIRCRRARAGWIPGPRGFRPGRTRPRQRVRARGLDDPGRQRDPGRVIRPVRVGCSISAPRRGRPRRTSRPGRSRLGRPLSERGRARERRGTRLALDRSPVG